MKIIFQSLGMFVLICLSSPVALASDQAGMLDNGTIRVGVDLNHGGSISFLADSKALQNIVNIHDLGRYIGQSYYSGPRPFGSPNPKWPNWPWNPVSGGDVYGHPGKILEYSNDGKTIYIKMRPMQWALDSVECKCTFETWINLQGTAVHVRNRLVNSRSDQTLYPAFNQELPAVYTVGTLFRIVSYTGSRPFTHDALTWIKPVPPPWRSWTATENWSALVNERSWGLGVFHQNITHFLGGFNGKPGVGDPSSDNTGYLSPISREVIGPKTVFEYEYDLILGNVETIRNYVYSHRSSYGVSKEILPHGLLEKVELP